MPHLIVPSWSTAPLIGGVVGAGHVAAYDAHAVDVHGGLAHHQPPPLGLFAATHVQCALLLGGVCVPPCTAPVPNDSRLVLAKRSVLVVRQAV